MATLVIETATAACSVALLDGARRVAARHEVVVRGHAERLVPMIGEVLAEADVRRPDDVLVDCGPGSFTGIRVGLAAARALGMAWAVPVHGFGALPLAAAGGGAGRACAVAMIGGHGELFVQRFDSASLPLDQARSLPLAAAAMLPDDLILGSAAENVVAARGWGEAVAWLPDAADAWRLPSGLAALPPRPVYGRPPDAALPR